MPLFNFMSRAGATELVRLNETEMARLHVTNGGIRPTKWTLESRAGTIYLKGERETWRGMNKFLLVCLQSGNVALHVIYDPEGRGDEIVKILTAHSLLINGDPIPISGNQVGQTKLVNGWINADYKLSDDILRRIAGAQTVGVAMQASYKAPIFMGFDGMEFPEAREKLAGFLNVCKDNRAQK
jgi:hypothetical protein